MEPMSINDTTTRPSLLRLEAVKARTCLSRSTIYAYMREGRFPQPVALTERCVALIEAEIDGWIADRIATGRRG